MATKQPMTFGEILDELTTDPHICGLERVTVSFRCEDKCDPEFPWRGPTGDLHDPKGFWSYRGTYDQPAFGTGSTPMNVRDFVKLIHDVGMGEWHHGWKGGEYIYDRGNRLWYGEEGVSWSLDWKTEHLCAGLHHIEKTPEGVVLVVDACLFR